MLHDKSVRNKKSVKSACGKGKKSVKAAESYGWVVEENEAWDAYDFAIESGWWDEAQLDSDIVHTLSVDELASSLAYIFRMNEFREWEERNDSDEDEIEESVRSKGRRPVKASKRRTRKSVKAARVYRDGLGGYQPWSGAVDTWNKLEEFGKIDALEAAIDELYYDESAGEGVINETQLNDLLWFEPETVYEWVGLYYNENTGEVSDEPFEDEIEESVRAKNKKAVKASAKPLSPSEKKACIDQIASDYGVTKKQATEWYKSYSDERRRLILDGGKSQAQKSFYND